ncbi:MAG: hypothetical protein LBM77_03000 [Spirochaetaceae bacterium]|jgi:hypothetical protein|nr:hypothetical protein [Spirochaetaceae bacterium]
MTTIPSALKESKHSFSFREKKEIVYGFQYIDTETNTTVLDCRVYTSRKPYSCRVIAAVWLHDKKSQRYGSGVGSAGGYGYHKPSMAIENALHEIGVKPSHRIGGVGYPACKEIFAEIMQELGYTNFVVAEFYA